MNFQRVLKKSFSLYLYIMTPHAFFALAILGAWVFWAIYWIWMARNVKTTVLEHPDPNKHIHRIFIVISALLLGVHSLGIGPLGWVLIPHSLEKAVIGLALTWGGIFFTIWARNVLADNWSAQPELKKDHTLIVTGPYKLARHPIYTGIIIAVLGTALMRAEVRSFIALLITFFALWHKSMFEEDLMRQQFGQQYDDYAKRVKRLIPWVI